MSGAGCGESPVQGEGATKVSVAGAVSWGQVGAERSERLQRPDHIGPARHCEDVDFALSAWEKHRKILSRGIR